jgi:NAD(P)-dependent dehydrogenase (short-subunit alcohol dehydrogenase family)
MNTVLITGTSSGIGRAAVQRFGAAKWQVAATMRSPDDAPEWAEHPRITRYPLDVTNETQARDTIRTVIDDLGHLDVLVNNAGIGVFGAFEGASDDQIHEQFDTNLFGPMRTIRAVLPHFRSRGQGVILNVSSGVGRMAMPMQSLYNASKWALEGFSEALQYELRSLGITVKMVEPGNVRTNFFDAMQRTDVDDLPEYQPYQDTVLENHTELNERGAGAEAVADVIFDAATDTESSQLRYTAGSDVSLFLTLRKFLPDRLFFWLVRSQLEPGSE